MEFSMGVSRFYLVKADSKKNKLIKSFIFLFLSCLSLTLNKNTFHSLQDQ